MCYTVAHCQPQTVVVVVELGYLSDERRAGLFHHQSVAEEQAARSPRVRPSSSCSQHPVDVAGGEAKLSVSWLPEAPYCDRVVG